MVAFFLQYGVQRELGVFTNHSPWTSRYVSSWGWSGKPRTMCKSNCNSTPITLAPIVAHLQIQQIQPTVTSLAWWLVKIFTPFLYGYGHSFIFKLPVTCWWVGDGIGWVKWAVYICGTHTSFKKISLDGSLKNCLILCVKQNEYWSLKFNDQYSF